MNLIRMLRLCRLARLVRLVAQFRVLWLLVQGLLSCVFTLFWTFILIFALIYMFGIFGLNVLVHEPHLSDEYNEAAAWFNRGLGYSMLTLLQFLTLDSIGPIYRPLILEKPALALYFILFILLCSIALMNLVVAVMVDSSSQQASNDREGMKVWEEQKRRNLIPKLKLMFRDLDTDNSGEIDLEEIIHAPEEVIDQLQQISSMDDIEELFACLDYDDSGSLGIDEFCEGILKAQGEKPLEFLRLIKQCSEILQNTRELIKTGGGAGKSSSVRINALDTRLTKVESRLSGVGLELSHIINLVSKKDL